MKPIENIIRKLRMLDSDAAEYVLREYNLGNIPEYNIIDKCDAITWLFTWGLQPQGEYYWNKLYNQYRELPNTITTKLGNVVEL